MKIVAVGILVALAACSPSRQIAVAATDASGRADEIHRLANRIGGVSTQPEVVADAAQIALEASAIRGAAGTIHRALVGVEDSTPWWGVLLQFGFWAVIVVAVAVILWQTGIGQAIRATIGLIPRAKRQEANLALGALDPTKAETIRELISARRAADPLFEAAWQQEIQHGHDS